MIDPKTNNLNSSYNPKDIETKWYAFWEKSGFFKPKKNGTPYCIMIPPPNVTGSLHMGHGFQNVLMDALIRYHRMRGFETLWQMGTDHAGIATQMVVERQLTKENISKHQLGRDKFIQKIWQWKKESGNRISSQLRRMGVSVDWSRERFTLDEGLSNAVKDVFIKLYDEKLIYRGKRLVNWDPKFQTAISDLEVVKSEENGFLWFIKYPLKDQANFLTIATTRPETIFADVALAVHPEDKRYKDHIGKLVQIPLTTKYIPVIADHSVLPDFGTGIVKITPAHDFNDYQVGKRHNLEFINILTKDACLNEKTPYNGLTREEARTKTLTDLTTQDLLAKKEKHVLTIPRGDRSHTIIEPYLTDQWFVKTTPLAKPAIDAVKNGNISFIPKNWENTYFNWLENIEDWCISRQLWWGHRIPAWYDEAGNCYVGTSEQEIRQKYNIGKDIALSQDEDVLDTWFSSALWPFSTLGWPETNDELKTFFPTNVLVTGFDIIFFWVARMIMFSLKFTNQVPFKETYITGLIRDIHGQKMSKSKGNVLDPLDLVDGISLEHLLEKRTAYLMQPEMLETIKKHTIDEFPEGIDPHGCDSLRFTFCALASTGRDIIFDMSRLKGYRNFCNKLWNATRFILMQCTEEKYNIKPNLQNLHPINKWILSRLQRVITSTHKHFSTYRFDLLAQSLHDFVWDEFCSWYIELAKNVLAEKSESNKYETQYILITILESIVRLLHPIIPFITEEIWQQLAGKLQKESASIMIEPFPETNNDLIDKKCENEIEWLKTFIFQIRNIRGEANIKPKLNINIILKNCDQKTQSNIDNYLIFIKKLAKIESVTYITDQDIIPKAATITMGKLEIYIPLHGVIDTEEEAKRLQKNIIKLQKDIDHITLKLNNPKFVENAPKALVEREKERLINLTYQAEKLTKQLKLLTQ